MSKKWQKRIMSIRWLAAMIRFAENIKPPGFYGMSLGYVMRFFIEAVMKGQLATRASAISFRLFLAFFPGIIMLLTLIPYIPLADFQENLFDSIRGFFPGDTFSLFESTLNDLLKTKHSGLLSLGFILVIYYASNSINAILIGFNSSYHLEEKGNVWVMRIASVLLIFILGILMTVAVAIIMFSGKAFDYLHSIGIVGRRYEALFYIAKWLVSVLLIYSIISTLYNVGVGRRWRRWRFMNVGATVATIFFILTSVIFAYFVERFSKYNELYGSLGTLMVLLIWLNFNCMIVLSGFELNMSIRKARRSLPKPEHKPVPIKNTLRHE